MGFGKVTGGFVNGPLNGPPECILEVQVPAVRLNLSVRAGRRAHELEDPRPLNANQRGTWASATAAGRSLRPAQPRYVDAISPHRFDMPEGRGGLRGASGLVGAMFLAMFDCTA